MTVAQKAWLTNLKGGFFKQTLCKYPYTFNEDGYTALGVANVLFCWETGSMDKNLCELFTLEVAEWLGIKFPWSAPFPLDDNSISFAQYADRIERNSHLVFKE